MIFKRKHLVAFVMPFLLLSLNLTGGTIRGFKNDGNLEHNIDKQETINRLSGTDDFGRAFGYVNGMKENKYVGLFYFTWLGQHGTQQDGIFNITRLLKDDPDSLWNKDIDKLYPDSPKDKYHFWAEPLYGYYNSLDPWVIRKHIELLTFSGVDFLVFDATNGFHYLNVMDVFLPILQEYYDAGWNVPKIVFYTNSVSAQTVNILYSGDGHGSPGLAGTGIYKSGKFKDLWFQPNGKPLIIGITNPDNPAAGMPAPVITDPEILNFFEIKESQWPNAPQQANGFPWMSFVRPQVVHGGDTINIGVAQHNKLPFSDALLNNDLANEMWGRGYTSEFGSNRSDEAIQSGLNFEEQFKVAKDLDVKYNFITGFNEWVAIKFINDLENNIQYEGIKKRRVFFVDTFNEEYSRDVEMMKGGYGDNFMLQMIRNTRDLKGNAGVLPAAPQASIDIMQGLTQWDQVDRIYYDMTGDAINRSYNSFDRNYKYVDNSVRNDITQIRVAHDNDFLYFLVETADDMIVDLTSKNWMNILIDVEGSSGSDWKNYNFVINRHPNPGGNTSIERMDGSRGELSYTNAGSAEISLSGKYIQYKIPKASIGLPATGFTINFKAADNITDPTNIESYYATGDSAPIGRINYIYKG